MHVAAWVRQLASSGALRVLRTYRSPLHPPRQTPRAASRANTTVGAGVLRLAPQFCDWRTLVVATGQLPRGAKGLSTSLMYVDSALPPPRPPRTLQGASSCGAGHPLSTHQRRRSSRTGRLEAAVPIKANTTPKLRVSRSLSTGSRVRHSSGFCAQRLPSIKFALGGAARPHLRGGAVGGDGTHGRAGPCV